MVTAEVQITYLAQQLNVMQTNVAALQGSATRYADLLVQLFTTERKVRMVIEAGDEATAVMSRLQALETRSSGAMTSVAQRFRGKGAAEYGPHTWSGREGQWIVHSIHHGTADWVGSLRDNMMKVMDVTEVKEGGLLELDIRNAGIPQETVDDFKEKERRQYQVLMSCTKEKRRTA